MKKGQIFFLVHFVLIEWFSLFSRVISKKMRKSLVLMEKEAYSMSFVREKKSYEVPRAQKIRLKRSRECMVSCALKHNCAGSLQWKNYSYEEAHGRSCAEA